MDIAQLQNAVIWYFVFLFSVTCHEAAHAFVAKKMGDLTAYAGGQVSLNPIPHIKREPFGMVLVPVITSLVSGWAIGWASVPLDPVWAVRNPQKHALVSLAGPAANFLLLIIGAVVYVLGQKNGVFDEYGPAFTSMFSPERAIALKLGLEKLVWFFTIENFLLATFNLLPLPPLDGASAIRLLLPKKIANTFWEYMIQPQFQFMGMFVAWRLYDKLADPLFEVLLGFLHILRNIL